MGRPAGRKIYAHAKLRRLRRERGMNQVELARALGLSTSYLNQIEHSRRPLTAPVLLRIAEVFGVDPEFFSEAGEERLATDLRAALLDEACAIPGPVPQEELADVARDHPEVARALVALHQRYRDVSERVVALASPRTPPACCPPNPTTRYGTSSTPTTTTSPPWKHRPSGPPKHSTSVGSAAPPRR